VAIAHVRLPVNVGELARRTVREVIDDNCFGLAAQLAFYFLLALFPALIFLVALLGLLPIEGILDGLLSELSRFAPPEVPVLLESQLREVAAGQHAGLLTLGIVGALWSSSGAMVAIIGTLNQAYDIEDQRPWWKTRLLAIGLTIAVASFTVIAQALLLLGPLAAGVISDWVGVNLSMPWLVARLVLATLAVILAIDLIYFFAPDAEAEWTWITPGAVVAALLWLTASLAFRVYLQSVADFSATYGTLAGFIVVMLWFYLSGFAILVGAELNAEIDRAAAYGVELDRHSPDDKPRIGAAAERAYKNNVIRPGRWFPHRMAGSRPR
jgi:membrane protein